jgi:hypothetical protein
LRIAAFILLGITALPVHSGEVVVLGRVSEIALLPEGHARCDPKCPIPVGSTELVCISNSCGCGEAIIEVEAVIVGSPGLRSHTAPYRLGEWCTADFPLDGEPIIVRTQAGESQWSAVHRTPDGEVWFEVAPFETIAGVAISDLPTTEGRISLRDLRAAGDL